MLNLYKIIFTLSICWTVGNCDVLDTVEENLELCGVEMPELATRYDYKVDTFANVTTKDGYILTVYCVYNATARNTTLNPVIAWHGLMDSSHTWCLNYRNQSLAFLLADRGYYTCLANARGNGFAQGHVDPSKDSSNPLNSYYKYSWDQIAEFDVPAVIDAVLLWTGKQKVIYIGHSQGATTAFALLSSNTSYNNKISLFAALAPVTYFSHTSSPLYIYAGLLGLEALYGYQYLPHTYVEGLLQLAVCTIPTDLCEDLLFLAFGGSSHIDSTRLPLYLCKTPSNFAWGQFVQYTQLAKVDKFQKYDFSFFGNIAKYGRTTPPQYDLTKITAPVALYYSEADSITANADIAKLISQLGTHVVHVQKLAADEQFNHLDYVWAEDVAEIVYNDLLDLIQRY